MKTDIREYAEGYPVTIETEEQRHVIRAYNQGGHDCTGVDLVDLLRWVKKEMPALWNRIEETA